MFLGLYSHHSQGRHVADRYRLRMHRARSVVLTSSELVEIRAAQRTFEGAYIRTAIGQFSFALIVLKIFTAEFYSIGALFAVYGAGILFISLFRRQQGMLGGGGRRDFESLQLCRQQAVLCRSRRRWLASKEIPNERQCGDSVDCTQCVCLHWSTGAHTATGEMSRFGL